MCRRLGLGHWNQVSFLAIADFASGSAGSDGSRMTQTGPQRKAALRFIFTKNLFARLQTQPFFPRLKSCGSAAGPI